MFSSWHVEIPEKSKQLRISSQNDPEHINKKLFLGRCIEKGQYIPCIFVRAWQGQKEVLCLYCHTDIIHEPFVSLVSWRKGLCELSANSFQQVLTTLHGSPLQFIIEAAFALLRAYWCMYSKCVSLSLNND